jgi:hypothetical protein
MEKTNKGQMSRPKLPGLAKRKTQTIKKGEFGMKQLTKGISGMIIIALGMMLAVEKVAAQEPVDTLIQAAKDTAAITLAMAPTADDQAMQMTTASVNPEPAAFKTPVQPAKAKTRNYEEMGNAMGFVLPVLTMVGLAMLALL